MTCPTHEEFPERVDRLRAPSRNLGHQVGVAVGAECSWLIPIQRLSNRLHRSNANLRCARFGVLDSQWNTCNWFLDTHT